MFTPGLEQVVHALGSARRSGRVAYPPRLTKGAGRRSAGEPAHLWMKRCIADVGGVEHLAAEENLALIIVLHLDAGRLQYANLQALWVEVPLATFATGNGAEVHRYIRVDYDLHALGPLLKEPLPHVHVEAEGEPRFPLTPTASGEVVSWFLDFVYRNYFYDDWIVWAELAWDDWCSETQRPNRWARLVEVFKQSNVGVLEADPELREDLLQVKRCVCRQRQQLFPIEIDLARVGLFGHDPT